ncbi:ELMO domain-containing protein 3-like isoform X2 [Oratosquilla oratoria]|uniref:ELMO domain-containing protein 3-like isoform X2 n=1 Tax=Oratosquilla oratoria TaxID=337810 RepID=UPI003F770987
MHSFQMLESPKQKDPPSEFLDVQGRNLKNQALAGSPDTAREDFTAAQDEWDLVQCVEPVIRPDLDSLDDMIPQKRIVDSQLLSSPLSSPLKLQQPLAPPPVRTTPHIDFDEVWEFFRRQDMSHVMGSIRPTMERRGVNGFFRTIFGPKKLKDELIDERNLLFAIAQCQFDNEEPIHFQVLQTIYKVLACTTVDCPRYGNHWDVIGFQGMDPATDLRGVGLLGLVHALHLVTHEATLPLARDVFRLSHDEVSQFPFMVLSINVTRISLQALREGQLNKECNSRGNVRHVLNEFFSAIMFHIYWIWKTEHKTIKDSGFLIKDAEVYCKKNVKTVLQKLQIHLRKYGKDDSLVLK